MGEIQNTELLRPADAAQYLHISRVTLWRLAETDPDFPRKIVLTPRCVGWRKSSLDSYLAKKEGEAA